MSIRIGSIAPDFEADSTQGRIRFHQWVGSSWCVLFSHPKDFTPVCTTELGYMARLKPEFERRNCKIAGLSVDRVEDHARWLDDIREVTGTAPNYPLIGDPELRIAYPMTTGRNFDEVLRLLDSIQLTARHKVATPVNWKPGEDVIIAGSVSDEEAKKIYPKGWRSPKPYVRFVSPPS